MSDDVQFDYEYLMQNALRGVMREVLKMVAEIGDAPGEHHFYIEFVTGAVGVDIPDYLREQYPERMTIVLQHQFDDLTVDEEKFSVALWFKGKQARLTIPFAAVVSFADPSAQFGVRFDAEPLDETTAADEPEEAADENAASGDAAKTKTAAKGDSAEVVSLDAFRKK